MSSVEGGRLDFFVSHAGTDEDWAMWLTQQLQNAGYTVELDVWNWSAGMDVIHATQRALDRASRVLAVWTPDYFTRRWADMEHRVSFAASQVQPGWLLPVVVRPCPEDAIPRLYRTIMRVDLVDLTEPQARERLLAAVAGPSGPTGKLPYPGLAEQGGYPGLLPPIWNVPNRNPFFVGRSSELNEMRERLLVPGAVVAVVAGDGAGGIGKSELAVEYAWRHARDYRLVWWLDAGQLASAEASLVELAALLDVAAAGRADTVVPSLYSELKQRTDWLMILDNAPGREQLDRLLPPPTGRVLVTSRDGSTVPVGQRVTVDRFSRSESMRLLRRRCPWLSQPAAVRIAAIVEDLPVSVAQAAAFLARSGMGADEYVPRLTERVGETPGEQDGGAAGLAATVAVGLERLVALDPAAADLLEQLALLAAEPVPLTAATTDANPLPGMVVGDPEMAAEIVSNICGLGLASQDGTHLNLHDRVHALIGESLTGQRRTLVLGRALRLLATVDPGDPSDPSHWPLYAAITPHLHAVTAQLPKAAGVTETVRFQRLLDQVCEYLRLVGRPQDSYGLADAAYRRRRLTHGDDASETLRWAVNRGAGLVALGRYDEARGVLADSLVRQRRVVGTDHPETLKSADWLGVTLVAKDDYEGARTLLLDTLDRRRRALGVDAPETLRSETELGAVLSSLGYHEQARRVFEDATTKRRRVLGSDHPDTLGSAFQLGLALAALGDHAAARGVFDEVTARRRVVLGLDHPDTLGSAFQLGLALAALGDHAAARGVFDEVTARRRVVLGLDHPDTLGSAFQLGLVLAALGDHKAARQALEDTLERQRRALSPSHPDTLRTEGSIRGLWPGC